MPPQIPSPVIVGGGGGRRQGIGEILLTSLARSLPQAFAYSLLRGQGGPSVAEEQVTGGQEAAAGTIFQQANQGVPEASTALERGGVDLGALGDASRPSGEIAESLRSFQGQAPELLRRADAEREARLGAEQEQADAEAAAEAANKTARRIVGGIEGVEEGSADALTNLIETRLRNPDAIPAESFNTMLSLSGLPPTAQQQASLEAERALADQRIAETRRISQDIQTTSRRQEALRRLANTYDLDPDIAAVPGLAEDILAQRNRSFDEIAENITVRLMTTISRDPVTGDPIGFVTSNEALSAGLSVASKLKPEESEGQIPEGLEQTVNFIAEERPLVQEFIRQGKSLSTIRQGIINDAINEGIDRAEAQRIATELIRTISTSEF